MQTRSACSTHDTSMRCSALRSAAAAIPRTWAISLTEAGQALFLLVAHDELTVADAARSLGLNPVAGRMRLARARHKLRAAMERSGDARNRHGDELRPGVAAAKEKP